MTAVNISGTFKKDARPHNGLEHIAEQLIKDELSPVVVVGVVVPHAFKKAAGEELTPTVRIVAIEPLEGDAVTAAKELLDAAREARGQGPGMDSLFDADGWVRKPEHD